MKRKIELSTLHVSSFVTSTNNKENTNDIQGGIRTPTDTNPYVCINYTRILGQCDILFTKYPICKPTVHMACAALTYTHGTECINTNNVCVTGFDAIC